MRRGLLILVCGLSVAGCATRPHTYMPPDDKKVKAAQADLTVKVRRVRETAEKAKIATQEAKVSADKLAALAAVTADKLNVARENLPPEYRPLLVDLETATQAQANETAVVQDRVANAVGWNAQLEGQVGEAEKARGNLQYEQEGYAAAAATLADDATKERNYRIAAEKQLSSQRWFGWLWKLGAFLLVAIVGLFFLLKWLGKLGWAATQLGIKATL